MKLRQLLILSICWGTACAENTQLPPVVDHSIYPEGVERSTPAPTNQALLDILARLQRTQNEVQSLRGQVEEQAHLIDELKRRQENIYTDTDERLQKLEGSSGGSAGMTDSSQQSSAPETPAAAPQAPEPQATDNVPQASEESASTPGETIQDTASESTSGSAPSEVQPKDEPVPSAQQNNTASDTAAPESADEKQLYQNAYGALKSSQYDQAITLLKQLTNNYPSGEYADNAYYWLGETYKIKQDAASSREAFQYLINNFPTSPKVPDAMLKLGFLEFEQHNRDKAEQQFNAVIAKYPGSSAATLAKNKLQQMHIRR